MRFRVFFADFASFLGGRIDMLELLRRRDGSIYKVTHGWSHVLATPQEWSPPSNVPLFPNKKEFQPNNAP